MAQKERALFFVRHGRTYREAAELCGATRNQVAGWCYRAGLRVGKPKGEKADRITDIRSEAAKAFWAKKPVEERQAHMAHASAARVSPPYQKPAPNAAALAAQALLGEAKNAERRRDQYRAQPRGALRAR